ncbi:glycosyltransferase [Persicobacter sp. CCB-QB2]|uniref:glycosyltransferase n=1 Tax=Persicobacter sp. CCB-QB2 TaxID=1561025 RepID=UPI0006A9D6C6|nr:glycosyltransferase [Persicobacter sp. CCB-QB2]
MDVDYYINSIEVKSGGPSRSLTGQISALLEKDINFKGQLNCFYIEDPIVNNFATSRFKINLVDFFALTKFLVFFRSLNKFKIVHLQGVWEWQFLIILMIGLFKDLNIVISPRGMLEPWALKEGRLKKKVFLLFFRLLLSKKCVFHCTAKSELRSIRSLGFENPISVISNGINLNLYSPASMQTKPKGEKTILFLSRIHKKKGLENLIKAWRNIESGFKRGWRLQIVGNGCPRYIADIRSFINEVGLENEVYLLPPLFGHDKQKKYHEADLFVLPTYSENFGIVVAEALACGVPVITTKGTPWEELSTRNAGWWIDIGVDPLVKALEQALQLPSSELREMGMRGRKLVEDHYSIEAVAEKMALLYEWILGKTEKPDFVYLD